MTEARHTTILIPGWMNDHTAERLDRTYRVLRIDSADAALLPAGEVAKIRGIASAGRIDSRFIDALPALEIIAHYGVGYDAVDSRHAAARGVVVTNTPDVLTEEVADTALGLLINTVRELPKAEAFVRAGKWVGDDEYPPSRLTLRERKVGIFGLGRIGLAVARRVEAFGLPVSYHNRSRVEGVSYAYHASLLELAEAVDTLISVAPGTPATDKAVNRDVLTALGSEGVFINIGRGSTVDEEALIAALVDGTIAAAGLDVFASEPDVPQALLDLPNVCVLPHLGAASVHTRRAMGNLVADNLDQWFRAGAAKTPVPECVAVAGRG